MDEEISEGLQSLVDDGLIEITTTSDGRQAYMLTEKWRKASYEEVPAVPKDKPVKGDRRD
jgi:hypothetical protein